MVGSTCISCRTGAHRTGALWIFLGCWLRLRLSLNFYRTHWPAYPMSTTTLPLEWHADAPPASDCGCVSLAGAGGAPEGGGGVWGGTRHIWSPDSTLIALCCEEPFQRGAIYSINVNEDAEPVKRYLGRQ